MIFSLFLVFFIVVVFITFIDLKLWGTLYTPAVVLVWPFFVLLIIDCFYLKANFTYFNLNENVIPIWVIGLLFFWAGGLFIKLVLKNVRIDLIQLQKFSKEITITKTNLRRLILISYLLIIFVGYKVYLLLLKYNFNLGDEDFQKNLGSGFIAHSILFLTLSSIFLIIFFTKKYYKTHQVLVLSITLILSVLYGVKSWIIIPLISAFLGRLLIKKTVIQLKHLIIFAIPFIVFWLIYQISLGMDATNNEFIFKHMANYLLAGPIGFSEHLTQGLSIGSNTEYAFTPLINIFRFIIGENPLNSISSYYVTIPTGFSPNVKTFFGTLYIYGGATYILTSFYFGLIFYGYLLLFCYTLKSRLSPFITVLYAFMLGLLFMGWFDNYVVLLTFYEAPIWILLLHLLFKIKKI